MIISISVKELEIIKHITDKYAIISFYFLKISNSDKSIKVVIIKNIHLVKDLKTKLLIENDILSSKQIDISSFTNSTYIECCEITIFITIKTEFRFQSESVLVIKTCIILFKSKCLISVHHMTFFSNRDFLFELTKTKNLFIYAYVTNFITSFILIRNEDN